MLTRLFEKLQVVNSREEAQAELLTWILDAFPKATAADLAPKALAELAGLETQWYPETSRLALEGYECPGPAMLLNRWVYVWGPDASFSSSDRELLEAATGHFESAMARLDTRPARDAPTETLIGPVLDELTGLPRREAFLLHLEEFIEKHQRFALLLLDVDEPGLFGPRLGDDEIKRIASMVEVQARAGDVVARCGKDEFAALFVGFSAEEAKEAGEKIRQEFIAEFDDCAGGDLSVSIGISCWPDHATPQRGVVRAAEDALFHAQLYDGSRVCLPPEASQMPRQQRRRSSGGGPAPGLGTPAPRLPKRPLSGGAARRLGED